MVMCDLALPIHIIIIKTDTSTALSKETSMM